MTYSSPLQSSQPMSQPMAYQPVSQPMAYQPVSQPMAYQPAYQPAYPMSQPMVQPTPVILAQPQADSSNPWKEGFNQLLGFLSQPIGGRSLNPMQGSPQEQIDYNTNRLPAQQYRQYQQTWETNPAYSGNYSRPYTAQSMPQSRNQVSPKNSQRNDGFPNSTQVSEYWSLDELNKYSCQLEDKITEGQQYITALARLHQATSQQLAALQHAMQHYLVIAERHDLMEGLLLDPNQLADWTLKMLDPQTGIYGSLHQGQYQSRPSFPAMPAPGGGGQAGQAWNQLEWAMDQNPAVAYQIVDRMSPADFQSRPMFVPN